MTIKEFNEFKFFIKYSKYNDIFIQKIIEHLNLMKNLNSLNSATVIRLLLNETYRK